VLIEFHNRLARRRPERCKLQLMTKARTEPMKFDTLLYENPAPQYRSHRAQQT
jgi:hypothetical protein